MRDNLKIAASDPYFQLAVQVGIQSLLSAVQVLSSVGLDITEPITDTLRSIHGQLADAAYEVTNLDALLEQARAIGDEVVTQTKEISIRPKATPPPEESDDKG